MLDELIAEEQAAKKKAGKPRTALDDLIEQDTAKQVQAQGQANASDPGFLASMRTAALPTLGNIGGALAGTLTGPAAPIAVPALEAAGGAAGEYLNQKLGITPPSNTAIGVQAVLPAAMRIGSVAKQLVPPTTNGANFLNTIAPREAEYQLGKLGIIPGQASRAMSAATDQQVMLNAPGVRDVIQGELSKMTDTSGSDIYKGTVGHLQRLDKALADSGDQFSPTRYQDELRDIRARLSANGESRPNSVEKASLLSVKSAMEDALSHSEAGQNLAGARKAVLRESVYNDLNDLTYNASKNQAHQGEQQQFNARAVLDKLEGRGGKSNEAFRRRFEAAFDPSEQKQVLGIYRKLNSFDKLAPGAGVNAGSMKILAPIVSGMSAGGFAHAAGATSPIAAGLGAAVMAAPTVAHAGRIIRLAMSTHEGRAALSDILADPKVKSWGALLPRLTQFLSATEPAQEGIRSMTTPIQPFPDER